MNEIKQRRQEREAYYAVIDLATCLNRAIWDATDVGLTVKLELLDVESDAGKPLQTLDVRITRDATPVETGPLPDAPERTQA